jgi:hypothetical protein
MHGTLNVKFVFSVILQNSFTPEADLLQMQVMLQQTQMYCYGAGQATDIKLW